MVQSSRDAILWFILTRLDHRGILQLYLKVMPCVVKLLHQQETLS